MTDTDKSERLAKASLQRTSPGRTPPHSFEAERGILGCLLLGGLEAFAKAKSVLLAGPACFYDLRNRQVWSGCEALAGSGVEIDLVTVNAHFETAKGPGQNWLGYICELPDATPSAANWEHYATVVWEKYLLRKIGEVCSEASVKAWEGKGDVEMIIEEIEQGILGLSQLQKAGSGQKTAQQLVRQFIDTTEDGWNNGRIGYKTGLASLDGLMGEMRPGNMIVIGAAPSIGKSSLAANIVGNNCYQGIAVGVFTLEMSAEEWLEMIIANETGYNPKAMELGGLSDENVTHVCKALEAIYKWPLNICDNGELTIQQLRSHARRWKVEHDIKILVVDYLQLVQGGKKFDNLTNEVTHISKQIKAMAKELQVPVVVLASLSRDSRRDNRRPRPEDLRQSGSIESDADKIVMLHPGDKDELEMIVAKNRRGPKGTAKARFQPALSRFTSVDAV